jgi:hypothetical protein
MQSTESKRLVTSWLTGVIIVWLLPLGLFAPKFFAYSEFSRWNVWDCAALFTRRAKVWGDLRAEARTSGGWQPLDFSKLSPQGLAGYRQRLDRVLEETVKHKGVHNMVSQVSEHLAAHIERLGLGHVYELRVYRINYTAGTPEMTNHRGNWDDFQQVSVSPRRKIPLFQAVNLPGGWQEIPHVSKVLHPRPGPSVGNRPGRIMGSDAVRERRIVEAPDFGQTFQ